MAKAHVLCICVWVFRVEAISLFMYVCMYCFHFSGVNGDSDYCNTFDFILGLVAMGSLTGANREFLIALQAFQDYFGTFEQFNSVLSPVISVF